MEIAVDILTQAYNLDVVVLASGNSDFVRLVRAIQNMGKQVEVVAYRNRVGFDLIREADAFTALESIEDIFMEIVEPPESEQPQTNESPALQQLERKGDRVSRFLHR